MLSGIVTTLEPREDACVWPDIYTAWLSIFRDVICKRLKAGPFPKISECFCPID